MTNTYAAPPARPSPAWTPEERIDHALARSAYFVTRSYEELSGGDLTRAEMYSTIAQWWAALARAIREEEGRR